MKDHSSETVYLPVCAPYFKGIFIKRMAQLQPGFYLSYPKQGTEPEWQVRGAWHSGGRGVPTGGWGGLGYRGRLLPICLRVSSTAAFRLTLESSPRQKRSELEGSVKPSTVMDGWEAWNVSPTRWLSS